MKRIGVIFGGRSGEHEVSLLSAASVIEAIDRNKYQVVMIGITREGQWKLYLGELSEIPSGAWEETAEDITVSQLKDLADFIFPVLHGPYGEDGTIQGLLPAAGCWHRRCVWIKFPQRKSLKRQGFRPADTSWCTAKTLQNTWRKS